MYVPLVVTLLQAVGGATQAAAPQVISVLVMPIQATGNVPPDLAAQFTAWFTAEAAAVPGYRVVAYSDVQGALSQEQTLQLAGCNESGCAAGINLAESSRTVARTSPTSTTRPTTVATGSHSSAAVSSPARSVAAVSSGRATVTPASTASTGIRDKAMADAA